MQSTAVMTLLAAMPRVGCPVASDNISLGKSLPTVLAKMLNAHSSWQFNRRLCSSSFWIKSDNWSSISLSRGANGVSG